MHFSQSDSNNSFIYSLIGSCGLVLVLGLFIYFLHAYNGSDRLNTEIPPSYIYKSLKSYVEKGSFEADEFKQINANLIKRSRENGSIITQDVYSKTIDGKLISKQSPAFAALGVPFYFFGGRLGIALLEISFLIILTIAFCCKISEFTSCKCLFSIIFFLLSSEVVGLMGSYNYDLFSGVVLLAGVILGEKRPLTGGFICALSVFVRPSSVIFFPIFAVYSYLKNKTIKFVIALTIVTGLFLVLNKILFGGWLEFSYFRIPIYIKGQVQFHDHGIGFSYSSFRKAFPDMFFSTKNGWFLYNPILFLVPFCFSQLWDKKLAPYTIMCFAVSLVNFVYIASYEYREFTFYGNRFLLPATFFLSSLVLIQINKVLLSFKAGTS